MNRLLTIAISIIASTLLAEQTQNALHLQLNREGLQTLADEIRLNHLTEISSGAVPSLSDKGPFGIDVNLKGIRYELSFSSLQIIPGRGTLALDLGLRSVKVHIDSAAISKKVFVALGTTCKEIEIGLGKARPVHARVGLTPTLTGGHLAAIAHQVSLPIHSDNFTVHGPKSCSGALGIGTVLKWLVHEVLSAAEKPIQQAVQKKIAEMTPELSAKIDGLLHQDFPITLPANPLVAVKRVIFTPSPYAMQLTPEGVEFALSATVSRNQNTWSPPRVNGVPGITSLGAVGVNPALPNAFLKVVMDKGTNWVELSDDLIPGLSEMLSVDSLSSMLPDLLVADLSSKKLRGFVKIAQPPEFSVEGTPARVSALFPRISLRLMAQQKQKWQDYYTIHLQLATGAALDTADGDLSFELKDQNEVKMTGEWASSYRPTESQFDNESAEMLVASLLDVVHALGPLVAIEIPLRTVGNRHVTVREPYHDLPFLKAKLLAVD